MVVNNHRHFYEDFHSHAPEMNKNEILKEQTRLKLLIKFMRDVRCDTVVVAGCGSGGDSTISAKKLVAFDLSYSAVKLSREVNKRNSYFVGDVSCVPLKNEVTDCVVCSEVVEHVVEPEKAIGEFQRVLKGNGTLILTVPNWMSWYGLARALVELISRRLVTAAYQPIDNWYTQKSLRRLIEPYFRVSKWRGFWYYPPIGRRDTLLPVKITNFFMRVFQPVNLLLGRVLPGFGHCLGFVCEKIHSESSFHSGISNEKK